MWLSIVIPVFNEAPILKRLLARLERALEGIDWEVVFINDGSTDGSSGILRAAARQDRRVKVLSFPRNFGHQAAITAGLDFAQGEAVAVMDADLQDPPELLAAMLELVGAGYDVVSPRRVRRDGETRFKRCSAALFYRLLGWMLSGRLNSEVGDFRMFSRRAVLAMRSFRERHRFMRGLVSWLGLKEVTIPFERPARAGGATKYSPLKMARLAWTAITSFSAFPLRVTAAAGVTLSLVGVGGLWHALPALFHQRALVMDWGLALAVQSLFAGLILLALGVIGDYVARNYEESKGRPLYVISDLLNVSGPQHEIERAFILTDRNGSWSGPECHRITGNSGRIPHAVQRG